MKTPPIACIHTHTGMVPSIFIPELVARVVDVEVDVGGCVVVEWLPRDVMTVCDIVA
jgi:hypothetical protein